MPLHVRKRAFQMDEPGKLRELPDRAKYPDLPLCGAEGVLDAELVSEGADCPACLKAEADIEAQWASH
jgi:hypothetical protein